MDIEDAEACYRAVKSRDRRFDGVFYTAVRSTGIYCRPSCPAITPHRKNVTFYRTAAAAQGAGFRACKRCLPDATPGSPDWDFSADAAGRAMRLIADGVVEREGVTGLAARVGYTPRHLSRLLTHEVGAGPLALARARRAQTARILVETTPMPFADVAFAAGFSSIRQFNDTVREVYAATPTSLRGRAARPGAADGRVELRLAVRRPYSGADLVAFLAVRAVDGVEEAGPGWYARTLRLPHGAGRAWLRTDDADDLGFVRCTLQVADLRDVSAAVERCRRLLDADCDPVAVDDELAGDPRLARLVRRRPGLRVPGHVDGHEVAVRAVLGQQVSVEAARRLAALLVERHGEVVDGDLSASPDGAEHTLLRLFPSTETLAGVDPETLPMPRARGRALVALCAALAAGDIPLDRSADRADVRHALLAVPGIGPWTAGYVALRALGDPDVFLPTDVGVRNGLRALNEDPARAETLGEAWRPWRSYALMHLWAASGDAAAAVRREPSDPTDRSRVTEPDLRPAKEN
ncbi:DNA-3-methyladenine glycosylase 2 family protein [Nocardioides jiangsuensis]|uniref:DNA-3-methyladenine glycosylase 2 family protein n=1 Tax=Nocardioides jiangsuensis TaxID=2866161 RepID=UPI0027E385A9|nr:AlkA N-terminal domain-containing protein [Nocardioides jiangsuensis]